MDPATTEQGRRRLDTLDIGDRFVLKITLMIFSSI